MRLAILGFGREGKSILKFIKKSPEYRGAKIEILDKKRSKNYLKNLEKFGIIFRSPGIPYNLPELKRARKTGVRFSSATKLFFNNCPTKNIIGVTGTKGKGTTSTLLYKILKASGRRVLLAGNIGKSALEILPRLKNNSLVVLELSSFQLQDLTLSPHIAVVLDIFPDHQDAHLNLREYYEAKTNVARNQKKSDKIFFFKDNALSRWTAAKSRGKKIGIDPKKFRLFGWEDLKIRGWYNFKNAVMAATVTESLGIPEKIILKTVKSFRGNEHRLEFVRKIGGVEFWNDSASTNPQTTAAAIKAFPKEGKILIAGGQDKGLDYKPLAQALKNSDTKLVILFGENKSKIAGAIKKSGVPIKFVKDLKTAIRTSYNFAKKSPPAKILFSPGATSFDMFENYANRGKQFKLLTKKL
ncbi:MAG: UDP-N-acetylmuramoyl-L-alanine--D-glutamate ligase [Patescibacteria group bacterium]|nr:UDP-N-acetylmuramoyl-L-alanine--D-glutamate ligase [Patescibacteria group bacterium]MDE2015008.1 UDP-N-acetylmuramoyl-L-alanine--D-glutamate ligase [Patescibacteria group bacterium]MDE2226436.1 UDP-N-acetylmuramoyl-L-alanine--D-glutamate ligase [Patescibacteria group bacterium]